MKNVSAIIMAAGLGTRMKSKKSKILHEVCGKPMIQCVLDALKPLKLDKAVLVLGYISDEQKELIKRNKADYVIQKTKKGTAHAVKQTAQIFKGYKGDIIILSGDVPLIKTDTLKKLVTEHRKNYAAATVLTAHFVDPRYYGRVVKSKGTIVRIVEELDTDDLTRNIKEINTGTYCFKSDTLFKNIDLIKLNKIKHEYYLTDMIGILNEKNNKVIPVMVNDNEDVLGVNRRYDLAIVNKIMQRRILKEHMDNGVTILDMDNTYIEYDVKIGMDTIVNPFTLIYGKSSIGERCNIGPFAVIRDSKIGNNTTVIRSELINKNLGDNVMARESSWSDIK